MTTALTATAALRNWPDIGGGRQTQSVWLAMLALAPIVIAAVATGR